MRKLYSFFKKRLWATMLIALLISFSAKAADSWTPGPNSHLIYNDSVDILRAWVDTMADGSHRYEKGDTLVLASASMYTTNKFCYPTEDVVIMGDPNLPFKPSLYCVDFGFRIENDTTSLELTGFNVIGWDPVDSTSLSNYLVESRNNNGGENLIFRDMECVGFNKSFFYLNGGENVYDTIIVDNCIIHGLNGGNNTFDFRGAIINYASITNSTVYGEPKGVIGEFYNWDVTADATPMEIIIDHNTFYNVVGGGSFLAVHNNDDDALDITISNNVISTLYENTNSRPFRINDACGSIAITNNAFHDFNSSRTGGYYNLDDIKMYHSGVVFTSNNETENPYFADAEKGDFTLANATYLTSASDGGAIGDPRWAPDEAPWVPGPGCHLIPNDSIDILKAWVDTMADGSHRYAKGDTLVLISPSMYTTNKFCFPTEDVVIMGDPRLSVKPSLYCVDFGFRLQNDTTSLELVGFDVIGWDPADSSSSGNYFLQSRYAGAESLVFKDIECVGFQGFFYLEKGWEYPNIIVDDCIIHHLPGTKYNTFDFKNGKIQYASVTNSTIYGEPRGVFGEFWASDTSDGSGEVPYAQTLVCDHNTFYNVVSGSSFLAVHNIKDQSLTATISNNIISTLYADGTRPFRYDAYAGSITMENNVFHDFISTRYNEGFYYGFDQDSLDEYYPGLVTTANLDTNNPYFADPEAGSFMLSDTSSLLAAGTDGGAIGDPRWIPVAGVTIDPLTELVVAGNDVTLTAQVNVSGEDKTVTWSVVNGTGSATIDASTGVLSAITAGTVTVKAASNYNAAISDELEITIIEPTLITAIALAGENADGVETTIISNKNGFLYVKATITPGDASDKSLTWMASEASDAEATLIEENITTAKVTASDCGTFYVVAMANDGSGIKDSIAITITGQFTPETVTLSGEGDATEINTNGGTLQILADVAPATNCDFDFQWSVDDESIATIDANGLLTAVADGTVEVTGKAFGAGAPVSGTLNITVSNQTTGISSYTKGSIQVMPNPANDVLFLQTDKVAEIAITNLVGSTIIVETVQPNEVINISKLTSGIYIVNIRIENELSTVRLVKE